MRDCQLATKAFWISMFQIFWKCTMDGTGSIKLHAWYRLRQGRAATYAGPRSGPDLGQVDCNCSRPGWHLQPGEGLCALSLLFLCRSASYSSVAPQPCRISCSFSPHPVSGVGVAGLAWIKVMVLGSFLCEDGDLPEVNPSWSGRSGVFRKAPPADVTVLFLPGVRWIGGIRSDAPMLLFRPIGSGGSITKLCSFLPYGNMLHGEVRDGEYHEDRIGGLAMEVQVF